MVTFHFIKLFGLQWRVILKWSMEQSVAAAVLSMKQFRLAIQQPVEEVNAKFS